MRKLKGAGFQLVDPLTPEQFFEKNEMGWKSGLDQLSKEAEQYLAEQRKSKDMSSLTSLLKNLLS